MQWTRIQTTINIDSGPSDAKLAGMKIKLIAGSGVPAWFGDIMVNAGPAAYAHNLNVAEMHKVNLPNAQ